MLLAAPLLSREPGLLHGFTERCHGNIAFHVGDDPERVRARQQKLADALGYPLEALVPMKQVHGDRIVVPDAAIGYANPPECDALITDEPRHPLMVMVADCTPVLLYDPGRKVIAAVHAGRAGAFKNIVGKCIARMAREFGSDPAEIRAVLGPSIRSCCYEIGNAICEEASELGFADATQRRDGRCCLDVNAILKRELKESGVGEEHIEILPHCTACEKARFFSYRADRQQTGRFAGIIMLK
jgi:YfiH family protein